MRIVLCLLLVALLAACALPGKPAIESHEACRDGRAPASRCAFIPPALGATIIHQE